MDVTHVQDFLPPNNYIFLKEVKNMKENFVDTLNGLPDYEFYVDESEYKNYMILSGEYKPFIITDKFVYRIMKKKIKDEIQFSVCPICTYVKIMVCYQDVITNERSYLVELYNGNDVVEVKCDSTILTSTGTQQILKYGCIYNEKNVKHIIEYLTICALKAPVEYCHSNIGWLINDKRTVFLGNKSYSTDNFRSKYVGHLTMEPAGSLDAWLQMVHSEILYNNKKNLMFAMTLGFSSIILGYLNNYIDIGNLMFNYYGNSSKGKTTAAMLATSVFSKPLFNNGLITTFNGTSNALITFVSQASSHTVAIDEVATTEKASFRKVLYQMCSGAERIRLNTSGELKKTKTFNSVIISTAEFQIIDETAPEGLKTRIFELEHSLTTDSQNSEHIKNCVLSNYAVAGEKFVDFIFDNKLNSIIDDFNITYKKIQRLYDKKEFKKHSLTDRILSKLSVVYLTSKYLDELFFSDNNTSSHILKCIVEIERSVATQDDISEKALDYIMQYLSKNRTKFITKNTNASDETLDSVSIEGAISNKSTYKEIIILKEIVEDILRKRGFENLKLILCKWESSGILITEKDRKYKRLKIVKYGEVQPCYVFRINY